MGFIRRLKFFCYFVRIIIDIMFSILMVFFYLIIKCVFIDIFFLYFEEGGRIVSFIL